MMNANSFGLGLAVVALLMLGCSDDTTTTSAGGFGGSGGSGGMNQGSGGDGVGGSGGDGGEGGTVVVADWSCLGTLPVPGFMAGSQPVTLVVTTLNGTSPVIGAAVDVCAFTDQLCDSPLVAGTTDDKGEVTLTVTTAEAVFARTQSAITTNTMTFINGAVKDDPPYSATPLTPAELTTFATQLGGMPMPGFSHVAALAVDCDNHPAAGIEFFLDNATPDVLIAYLGPDGTPDLEATETSSNGGAIFINVPPGTATVSATIAADNTFVSDRVVLLRANWLSDAAPNSPTPRAQ